MNREIKFKVWDIEEKEMYEPHKIEYINFYDGFVTLEVVGFIEFEDAELLQYTGLKDKNGKEIYEGDILLLEKGTKRTVFSVPGGFAIESLDDDLNKYGKEIFVPIEGLSDEQNASFIKSTKIIGNIYENPELLEGIN